MTDPKLKKRVQRFFFALDHFYENGLSEYWLQEMKTNRRVIENIFREEEDQEADILQQKNQIQVMEYSIPGYSKYIINDERECFSIRRKTGERIRLFPITNKGTRSPRYNLSDDNGVFRKHAVEKLFQCAINNIDPRGIDARPVANKKKAEVRKQLIQDGVIKLKHPKCIIPEDAKPIVGFSNYRIDEKGIVYKLKDCSNTEYTRKIKGENYVNIKSDDNEWQNFRVARLLICASNGIDPRDMRKAKVCVSKDGVITTYSQLAVDKWEERKERAENRPVENAITEIENNILDASKCLEFLKKNAEGDFMAYFDKYYEDTRVYFFAHGIRDRQKVRIAFDSAIDWMAKKLFVYHEPLGSIKISVVKAAYRIYCVNIRNKRKTVSYDAEDTKFLQDYNQSYDYE